MVADCEDLFEKRIDQYIDRYAEEIGYVRVEELLQERAQDMRELAPADSAVDIIDGDDIDGYQE